MKYSIMKYLILLFTLFIAGCDNSTESSVDPLVGIWEGIEYTITIGETTETFELNDPNSEIGTVNYEFGADGIYTHTSVSSNGTITSSGTWSSNDGELTIVDGDNTDIMDFTLSDNTLTLIIEVGDEDEMPMTMVVTFIRQ